MPIVSRERREFLRIEETELARSIQLTPSPGRMAAEDPLRDEPLVSVEFEVFGKVQGKGELLSTKEGRRVFDQRRST